GVYAVGIEPPSDEITSTHPGSVAPLSQGDPGPGCAARGGKHLHPPARPLHAARAPRARIGEGTGGGGGGVAGPYWYAVLWAPPVGRRVLVQEALANEVRLVVLIDPGPSQQRIPQHGADPGVLERGTREAGWVPAERLERRVDEQDAEAESTVDE